MGGIILHQHALPTTDLFTFSRFGAPWANQAWLMELVLYALNRLGGIPLVIFFHAVTITTGYVLLLAFSTRTYGIRIGVLATLAGAGLGIQNWSVRPQTVSFLAFGLLVYLIEAHRRAATPARPARHLVGGAAFCAVGQCPRGVCLWRSGVGSVCDRPVVGYAITSYVDP